MTCNPCLNDQIGRITVDGAFTEFPAPSDGTLGGIAVGPDGALWSTVTQFADPARAGIWRTPVCALGLSASYAGTTLSMNFNMGIDRPANWSVLLQDTVEIEKPVPALAPPRVFAINVSPFPNKGNVRVTSELRNFAGQVICSEWTTVNTSQ